MCLLHFATCHAAVPWLCRPDTRTVFVGVGLGFFVELSRVEALEFTETKMQHLSQ